MIGPRGVVTHNKALNSIFVEIFVKMESVTYDFLASTVFVFTVLIGASVLILMYFIKMFKHEEVTEKNKNDKSIVYTEKKKDLPQGGKRKKKIAESRWTGKHEKHSYNHPWLLVSLKGHTGNILDMDFSSNGKYLTSCDDEDPDPGGKEAAAARESNKEHDQPPENNPSPKGLSRRQRKNRRREDTSPSDSQKLKKVKAKKPLENTPILTKKQVMSVVPLKQFQKFSIPENMYSQFFQNYLLNLDQMMSMGYPIQSSLEPTLVVIYKNPRVPNWPVNKTVFNLNAREFVPKNDWSPNDSGQGSGSSSDSGENFDGEESTTSSSDQDTSNFPQENSGVAPPPLDLGESFFTRTCTRCSRNYYTTEKDYITAQKCYYHWGKLQSVWFEKIVPQVMYSCCRGKPGSRGCTEGKVHVWSGLNVGMNGLYGDYVYTKQRKTPPQDGNYGVYALDCEMCYTVNGLELTKVTVVGVDGRLVYDSFVKPESEIVDYNTKFSGITAKDMKRNATKTLKEVQNDLMGFINADTILIGHGLENDLRALKIVHYMVVDTAHSFPHYHGLPYRRSLRNLTSSILKREIQCSSNGHNSYEDACACMELMLWKMFQAKSIDFYTTLYRRQTNNKAYPTKNTPIRGVRKIIGTVFLWDTKDFTSKDRKSLRVNIEFDHATLVKWSPDCKAFIINKYNENTVEVYKVEKKKDGWLTASKAFTFPKHHETDVIGMAIATNGKFIITCSNKADLVLWDLKGQKLSQLDTYLMNNTCAKISPCGKFIVVSGFSPEAKVWEVIFNKSGEFQEVKPIKELTLGGHTSGVYDVAFDVDSSHMATVSKDGTWHLYDTKVSYKLGENARLRKSGQFERSGNHALTALSPNAEVLAIATSNDVALYSTWTAELDYKIEGIYEGDIAAIMFDSTGKYLLTAGDKQIRVFHNVIAYKYSIQTAKEKLKENVTSATKERLQKLIKENQEFLDNIDDK